MIKTAHGSRDAALGPLRGAVFASVLLTAGCAPAAPSSAPPPASASAPAAVPSSSAAQPTVAPSSPGLVPFPSLPTAAITRGRADAMQAILDAAVAAGAPDAIAAVITADGSWAGASGIGGPDGRKATVADEFAIANVTKVITASLVMRLVEQGRMDLDTPLSTYLGDVKVDSNGATVRQFLGARSGMADFVDPPAAISADPAHHWTIAELLARIPPAADRPGDRYLPVGPNYILLGLAVEHVTGKTLSDALRDEVLDPFGATRILEQGAGVATPKPWALPTKAHLGPFDVGDLGAGGAISCISSASFGPGSGSIASDAPSLAAWTWHLFAGDIIDRASLATMLPGHDGHGLGLNVLDRPLDQDIGLNGGKTGYATVLAVIPDARVVAVVLVNDENFRIDPFIFDLTKAARGG